MVDEEQPVRIVLPLDFRETRVVAPPVRVLPSLLEVIALAHVSSCFPCDGSKLVHASINALGSFPAVRNRRLMPGNSRICGPLAVGPDRESEGVQSVGSAC